MLRVVKWVAALVLLAVVGAFLHYVLPKQDVITISDAYNRFVEPGEIRGIRALRGADPATGARPGVDVFFISGRTREGRLVEYRNEDTRFGMPLYLKFNSATVQNLAQESVSTPENPRWVVVRSYGWRVPFLDMFPNAVSLRPAESRDMTLIPWFNIVFLTLLVALVWAVWARVRRWRRRRADPVAASWTSEPARRGWFGRG